MNSCPLFAVIVLAAGIVALIFAPGEAGAAPRAMRVYIGTYTSGTSKGIYTATFDPAAGTLSAPQLAAETKNPSFLAVHPNRRFLYAVGELNTFAGQRTGAVSAFRIEAGTGQLTLLNQQPSGGTGPTHLAVDKTGKCLLVANYGSGSIAALPIGRDGQLGPAGAIIQHEGSSINPKRQTGPHAHFITPSPDNRQALVCDLGLDKVLIYRLDARKAALAPAEPPFATVTPGAGPRHLVFHPKGRFVYVVNELSSTVTAFTRHAKTGALEPLQTLSTLPEGYSGENTCAEVQVHPSGQFVYASNRGHDSIAVFAVDARGGQLRPVEQVPTQGKAPRHFALDPSGRWLFAENQGSDTIVMFGVDATSGRLSPTGQVVPVGAPVCVEFVAAD